MNLILCIPLAYLLMLITNNSYFFEFNFEFHRKFLNKEKIVYDSVWLGVYQLFRGLYYFTILGLSVWNIKTFPNTCLILFAAEFFRPIIRHRLWFLIINLSAFSYLIYTIFL
jgi:hypothetical protein